MELLTPHALRKLVQSGQPLMVEFYSPTCPHCAALEPVMAQLERAWGERMALAQVDLLEHPDAAQEWTVMGTPTVLFFDNGVETARLTGVQGQRQYERELARIAGE